MASMKRVWLVQGDAFNGAFLAAETAGRAIDRYVAEFGPCKRVMASAQEAESAEGWADIMVEADGEPLADKLRRWTEEARR